MEFAIEFLDLFSQFFNHDFGVNGYLTLVLDLILDLFQPQLSFLFGKVDFFSCLLNLLFTHLFFTKVTFSFFFTKVQHLLLQFNACIFVVIVIILKCLFIFFWLILLQLDILMQLLLFWFQYRLCVMNFLF